MKISIVVAAYNESGNIKATIQEFFSVLNKISDIEGIEIIVVDDHSRDNTFGLIKEMNDPRVKSLRLSRRCGSHIALRAGIKEATGSAVLCISADGQDDPNCFKEMLEKWRSGVSVVWALRKIRKGEPWYIRKPAELFFKLLLWLLNKEKIGIDLFRADFFLLDRSVVNAINACPERNTSLFGLILWLGFKQDSIEYNRRIRLSGSSKWSFRSRFNLAKDWIIAFSGLPLKIMPVFGFFVALSGFLYALYVILNAYLGNPIAGWSSIMVAVLFLGGVQMIMLGIAGEYLWRNLDESRKRPLYFIEKKTTEY